jgi:hypothetical protein
MVASRRKRTSQKEEVGEEDTTVAEADAEAEAVAAVAAAAVAAASSCGCGDGSTSDLALNTRAVGATYQASLDALLLQGMACARWGVNTDTSGAGLWQPEQAVDVVSHVARLAQRLAGSSLLVVNVTTDNYSNSNDAVAADSNAGRGRQHLRLRAGWSPPSRITVIVTTTTTSTTTASASATATPLCERHHHVRGRAARAVLAYALSGQGCPQHHETERRRPSQRDVLRVAPASLQALTHETRDTKGEEQWQWR